MDMLPSVTAPSVVILDVVGPAVAGIVFILLMQLVPHPSRRTWNAILVGGASGVYLSGGFGVWELIYPVLVTPVVYRGLVSYRYIGAAWLLHSSWDVLHHLWGNPIWPFMPTSSFGCAVFDAVIAVWFLADAPAFMSQTARRATAAPSAD